MTPNKGLGINHILRKNQKNYCSEAGPRNNEYQPAILAV